MSPTRREVLRAGAGAATGALAGCLGGLTGEDTDGYAAFFPLWDWAEAVGDGVLAFENAVDTGEMGHGWSPGGDIVPAIVATDLFIYLDTPEFQWAQDVVETLRRDHADEVFLVDALEGLEPYLLPVDGGGERSEQAFDPHVWVDPVLAGKMVDTIAEELAAYDPDNADTYRENADTYRDALASVDEQFDQLVADAELDIAVFAGHDSFQYLEHRYGFELVTPTGISPDEDASFEDISGLIEVIEEHGIDTVLYDPFEAARPGEDLPQLVEAIFENSDIDEAAPLSPVSGVTPEWDENGWGWVEQMEQVNLQSLDAALNPSSATNG